MSRGSSSLAPVDIQKPAAVVCASGSTSAMMVSPLSSVLCWYETAMRRVYNSDSPVAALAFVLLQTFCR